MSEKKGWGSTVMGWFVVQEPSAGGSDSEGAVDLPADASADDDAIHRAASAEPINVFTSQPPVATGGDVNFDEVFEAAGIDSEERGRVSKTLELLDSLPAGTEETVKKQIVSASLRAFGVPIEHIIEAGAQEIQALEAYIRAGAADTEQVTSEAELRIKQFEEEIVKLRQVMQERVADQQKVVKTCNAKKLEVQKVLEFFGRDAVAKVVRDSPKLQEPA